MDGGCVIAVFGPTGVGKTPVAVELAALLGTHVISCDSLQVYRGLPVLTNQPSEAELARAPHELVAIADPAEEWSADRYAQVAVPALERNLKEHGRALMVGGTGLYMRAALAPLDTAPPVPPALRAALELRAAREGLPALHAELARLDPEAAAAIDPRNARRVLRALGVITAAREAQEPLGQGAEAEGPTAARLPGQDPQARRWSGRSDLWHPHYRHPTVLVGLTRGRAELYERINLRTQRMLAEGAIEEVEALLRERGATECREPAAPSPLQRPYAAPPPPHRRSAAAAPPPDPALMRGIGKAIGFRLIVDYLYAKLGRDELEERLAAGTHAYARRQLTWMRKMDGIVIMDAGATKPEAMAAEIVALANSRSA